MLKYYDREIFFYLNREFTFFPSVGLSMKRVIQKKNVNSTKLLSTVTPFSPLLLSLEQWEG